MMMMCQSWWRTSRQQQPSRQAASSPHSQCSWARRGAGRSAPPPSASSPQSWDCLGGRLPWRLPQQPQQQFLSQQLARAPCRWPATPWAGGWGAAPSPSVSEAPRPASNSTWRPQPSPPGLRCSIDKQTPLHTHKRASQRACNSEIIRSKSVRGSRETTQSAH